MDLKIQIALIIFVIIGGFVGIYLDYAWTASDAKEINACVEYKLFPSIGFRVAKCEPGQMPGDWF
jgi:hypothetical protein